MSKIVKKKTNPKDDGKHLGLNHPQIDKLSGVVKLVDEKLCGSAYSVMLDWLKDHELGITPAQASTKYPLAVKIHFPTTDDGLVNKKSPFVLVQITHKKMANRHVRFEYNPVYMTEAGADYLDVHFMLMFGVTFYEFLHYATFTRMDWCRDIYGADIEDYLIRGRWWKTSQCFFDAASGKLETVTFGHSGGNQVSAYDKAKQLYGAAATDSITRIEARLRTKIPAKELKKITNPFDRVELYSTYCPHPPFGLAHWRAFQDSCRLRGINNAIKAQPANCRSALKKVLSALPVSWWAISPEDWETYLLAALAGAGLLNIPDHAPPLSLQYHVGLAA